MSLHPDVEKKIMALGESESLRRGFLDIFRATAKDAEIQNLPSGTLMIPFYDAESGLQPGDWAAELHLVVRQVESINEDGDPNSHPAVEQQREEEAEA